MPYVSSGYWVAGYAEGDQVDMQVSWLVFDVLAATLTTTQSSRYNNSNTFYSSTVSHTLPQASRFDNNNNFYTTQVNHTLEQLVGVGSHNLVPNSTMVGAGVGTFPTGWSAWSGITCVGTGIGTGAQSGIPYIDIRVQLAAAGSGYIDLGPSNAVRINNKGSFVASLSHQLISGTVPSSIWIGAAQYTSSGTYVTRALGSGFTPTTTVTNATTGSIGIVNNTVYYGTMSLSIGNSSGSACDYTFRIYSPALTLGSTQLPYVPTSGTAATIGSGSTFYSPTVVPGQVVLREYGFGNHNLVPNSTMQGAITGTPGTLPTGWTNVLTGGLNMSIVGTGTEDGYQYIDIKYAGTASGSTINLAFFNTSSVVDTRYYPGISNWYTSYRARLVDIPSNYPANIAIFGGSSSATSPYISASGGTTSSKTLQLPGAATLGNALCLSSGYVGKNSGQLSSGNDAFFTSLYISLTISTAYDFTVRIAAPSVACSLVPMTYVPTYGTVVDLGDQDAFYSTNISQYFELSSPLFTNTNTFYTPTIQPGVKTLSQIAFNRVNLHPNSTYQGFTTGTPGASSNWNSFGGPSQGISRDIVALGTENGIPYIDVRMYGTGTGNPAYFEFKSNRTAYAGQTFTNSAYLSLIAGTLPTSKVYLQISDLNSGSYLASNGSGALNLTATQTRYNVTRTLTDVRTNSFSAGLQFSVALSETIDFTIRIAGMQTEYGNTATALIPTSGTVVEVPTQNTFYSVAAYYIQPQGSRFDNTNTFYNATVSPGPVTLTQATRFDNATYFSPHVIGQALYPERLNNSSTFYSATAIPGATTLNQVAFRSINLIPNSSMVGAGTGVLPTGWSKANTTGITTTVVGTGTENGVPYLDINWSGTATGTAWPDFVIVDGATGPVATAGMYITGSITARLISGTVGTGVSLSVRENNSAGSYLNNSSINLTLTGVDTRVSVTRLLTNLTTGKTGIKLFRSVILNDVVDITIRIKQPQLEYGSVSSPYISTSTVAVEAPVSNTFYTESVEFNLPQASRFNNTNLYYAPQLNLTLPQASRFNNTNTFYIETVSYVLPQATRFNNTNNFYSPLLTFVLPQVSRFNNTNTFYSPTLRYILPQATRFNNTNSYYTPTILPGPVTTSPTRLNNSNSFFTPFVTIIVNTSSAISTQVNSTGIAQPIFTTDTVQKNYTTVNAISKNTKLGILYKNIADTAILASANTSISGFPITNMQSEQKHKLWRVSGNSVSFTMTWTTGQTISALIFPVSNLNSSAIVRVRTYSDEAGTSIISDTGNQQPILSTQSSVGINTHAHMSNSIARIFISKVSNIKHCKVDITDTTPQGYIEIARLVCGELWNPTYGTSYGLSSVFLSDSKHERTEAGNIYTDRKNTYKSISFDLNYLTVTDRQELLKLINVSGTRNPLFVSIFPNSEDPIREETYQIYGKVVDNPTLTNPMYSMYATNLTLESV